MSRSLFTEEQLTPLETKIQSDLATMQASSMVIDPKLYEAMIQLAEEVYLRVQKKDIKERAEVILKKHYNP